MACLGCVLTLFVLAPCLGAFTLQAPTLSLQAYLPISPLDIPVAPPPDMPVDDYLRSRIERFYEDLTDGGKRRRAQHDREREREARESYHHNEQR